MVAEDVGEAEAGGVIGTDMNISPTDTLVNRSARAVPADVVAYSGKAHQRLDGQIDQLTQMFAQIAANRMDRFVVRMPGEAGLAAHPAHGAQCL